MHTNPSGEWKNVIVISDYIKGKIMFDLNRWQWFYFEVMTGIYIWSDVSKIVYC